jgi:hypothetical protein
MPLTKPSGCSRTIYEKANRWQPYSIQIGGRWYSYNRLDPLGMMMGMAADDSEMQDALF